MTKTGALTALLCLCVVSAIASPRVRAADAKRPALLVLAAASLGDVLGELSADWTRQTGMPVKLSVAASSVLARQIEAGNEADVFISADREWMDYLAERKLVDVGSRRDLVGNSLVLIAPADSRIALTLQRGVNIAAALGTSRLATGDPATVPAGRYARAAFESLGMWDQLKDRLVPADNVRGALTYVARGEVPLGVVYATDAKAEKAVRIIATFPASTHAPIVYPAALTAAARAGAIGYLTYLSGADAGIAWRKYGFQELPK